LLGDDPRQPTYIETVPRLGYRLVASVSPWPDQLQFIARTGSSQDSTSAAADVPAPGPRRRSSFIRAGFLWAGGAVFCAALAVVAWAFLVHGMFRSNNRQTPPDPAPQLEKSIAVLPFLDLTQGMKNEEFADGMTEELIDKLSKIPGLRVPGATSSFYFKGKQIPVADIARTLGVVYVLDGSVRKSGGQVRVAARLMRADNGYIIWSETFDRPFNDILTVQDDIAGEVTKALRASIEAKPNH
jgi:TolB-like protein